MFDCWNGNKDFFDYWLLRKNTFFQNLSPFYIVLLPFEQYLSYSLSDLTFLSWMKLFLGLTAQRMRARQVSNYLDLIFLINCTGSNRVEWLTHVAEIYFNLNLKSLTFTDHSTLHGSLVHTTVFLLWFLFYIHLWKKCFCFVLSNRLNPLQMQLCLMKSYCN